MDKENGERDKSSAPGDSNPLLDPLSVFAAGHGMLGGGLPASYGHHLTNAYSALLGGSGSRAGQYPATTSSYGTLSVAASQAASLGINPASAAWWTMASQLAAHDYLARLQAAGMPFTGLPSDMAGFPGMSSQHSQVSGGSKQAQTTKSHSHTAPSTVTSSHHRDPIPSLFNDPTGVLGGVRLPPDTEIIKYTSSIIGPKVPGTTNRGRKKTISLDPPSVSVTPTQPLRMTKSKPESQLSPHPRETVTNGQITPLTSIYPPPASSDCDAPLNLSLKPASATTQTANNALQSLSSLSQSLGQAPDRVSRRKPGPKPRRVTPSPLPPPGPAPSASLAQLFAAADSPRPSSGGEETDSTTHHKDGRPRNLGRGVSKPKKNTVASLLAQSRALGIKPGLDFNSPLNHQVALLKANIQQQMQIGTEGENETEDKPRTSSPCSTGEDLDRNKKIVQQGTMRSLESHSETSSVPDVSSDTNSDSEASDSDMEGQGTKREGDPLLDEKTVKKQKLQHNEDDLRVPLRRGWKRETMFTCINAFGIQGDVVYTAPCGTLFKQRRELQEYLERNYITHLKSENFSFNPKIVIGDFIQQSNITPRAFLTENDMAFLLSKLEPVDPPRKDVELSKLARDRLNNASRQAKKAAKKDAARNKELARFIKEQEKCEKQEAIKKEREQRSIQMIEARKKRQEEAGKLKQEEQQRKQQEREMKRQQTALLKEQIYMQELTKQRELLYTVELERERRRQHMALVKSLEARKKQEEKEKRRLEVKAEKMATREKRMEQRRIEMDLLCEIRKPVEDMELPDLKPLPELSRIPGLKLAGQAFADTIMVFEFLHNYGETLGFDMGSLPTLNSLQNALLGDEEAEEELLSVMTHLIICAIEDPGIPNPARHTTLLGQSLKQADITHSNLSEILRIYLYANATGEVKALTGVQFEREREKKMSDHHNNMNESAGEESEFGKNAAFFVALRENPTWKMSESLKHKPFLALNATQKAKILQFLCHELLQNKAVIRQIEGAIETVAQLKRDRWTIESKLRKLRHLHNRKVRQMAIGMMGGKLPMEGVDDEHSPPKDHEDDEDGEGESGNESEGTQPEEEEDKKLSIEEMARKLEKLNRQAEQILNNLAESGGQLRAICYGQDRYWRRYWSLPKAGGLFVEGMESAEPELFEQLLQEDTDSLDTPDIKSEYDAEALQCKPINDDEEMPHLTPEVDTVTLLSKLKQQESIEEEPAELTTPTKDDKKETGKNGRLYESEPEEGLSKNDCSEGEEESDSKLLTDYKKTQSFQADEKCEDMTITNGITEQDPPWFSVLPREPCDLATLTNTTSAFRCGTENSELRIPVFPPPPVSPSPSQCDSPSPAPLALTPEETTQLEYCKIYGLPRPAPAKPIPYELRCGWWRITDSAVLQNLVDNLHSRGARERELRRSITRPGFDHSSLKMCLRQGSPATELHASQHDMEVALSVPPRDGPEEWNYIVAARVDMAVLEQLEAMEDKVANASMQVKGWKPPPRTSPEDGRRFQPSCSHPPPELNPIMVAKTRLIQLESAIERRYLKPPLGINVTGVDVAHTGIIEPDTIPKGLVIWREAVSKSQTAAQLSMALHMLEASIAWDKSIMKANCQFCHSGDNEDKLLLCDGCDKGYHTYCFKPKMENIPEGDWYCYECMNKATGDKGCIVCGKKLGRNLVVCDNCPKAYHTDCLQPPITKVPRGKWHCPTCLAKLPRKRLNTKRTATANSNSPQCDGSTSNNELILSPVVPEEAPPESPPPLQPTMKKEKSGTKKMAKEMSPCRQLLDDLETHDEAWPFLLPVNTKQFPTYKKIIKNPMDFSTIKKRLMDSIYKSREEFCSDVRLIFNNCETFNEDDSPVGKAGHNMRLFFETRWTELTSQKPQS